MQLHRRWSLLYGDAADIAIAITALILQLMEW
jgi:hypothetical protein